MKDRFLEILFHRGIWPLTWFDILLLAAAFTAIHFAWLR